MRLDPADILLERRLGVGAQGAVWQAALRGVGPVAVKVISHEAPRLSRELRRTGSGCLPSLLPQLEEEEQALRARPDSDNAPAPSVESAMHEVVTARELASLRILPNHPNVVSLIGWFHDAQNRLCLVMELLGPSLAEAGNAVASPLRVVRDLCAALAHLHAEGIVHRDMKPENVLMTPDLRRAKLSDFGVARSGLAFSLDDRSVRCGGGLRRSLTPRTGTLATMAPEVYTGRPYGTSCDVYSLGRLLQLMKVRAWKWRGHEVLDSVEALCLAEPDERPTVQKLLAMLTDACDVEADSSWADWGALQLRRIMQTATYSCSSSLVLRPSWFITTTRNAGPDRSTDD